MAVMASAALEEGETIMTRMTQRQKIIDYCGLYDVKTEEESRTNASGETVRFNRYYISPAEQGSVRQ